MKLINNSLWLKPQCKKHLFVFIIRRLSCHLYKPNPTDGEHLEILIISCSCYNIYDLAGVLLSTFKHIWHRENSSHNLTPRWVQSGEFISTCVKPWDHRWSTTCCQKFSITLLAAVVLFICAKVSYSQCFMFNMLLCCCQQFTSSVWADVISVWSLFHRNKPGLSQFDLTGSWLASWNRLILVQFVLQVFHNKSCFSFVRPHLELTPGGVR